MPIDRSGETARTNVDRFTDLEPRSRHGDQQRLDGRLGQRMRIARVVHALVDEVAEVRARGPALVHRRVALPNGTDLDAGRRERRAGGDAGHLEAVDLRTFGDEDRDPERGQAIGVDVIGMLVRDEACVGADELVGLGPGARVDQEHDPADGQADAGVGELRDADVGHLRNTTGRAMRQTRGRWRRPTAFRR